MAAAWPRPDEQVRAALARVEVVAAAAGGARLTDFAVGRRVLPLPRLVQPGVVDDVEQGQRILLEIHEQEILGWPGVDEVR